MSDTASALIARILGRLPSTRAIYVFGSRADGEAPAGADLDMSVLVDGQVEPVALWELAGELADIAGRHVDLVDLRGASTVMQYQIITTGRRLWHRGCEAGIYEAFVLSEKTDLDTRRAALIADVERRGTVHGR